MMPKFLKKKIIKTAWGAEHILDSNDLYCFKILEYDRKGNYSSFHGHCGFRDYYGNFVLGKVETWYVLSGNFRFSFFDDKGFREEVDIQSGDIIHLDRGVFHRLELTSDFGQIMEASTKDDKRDIVRVQPGLNQL